MKAYKLIAVCEGQKEFESALKKIEAELKRASESITEVETIAEENKEDLADEYKAIMEFIKIFDNSLHSLRKKVDIRVK